VQGESRTTSARPRRRGIDNTFVLKGAVSERHAELRPSRLGFAIRDLESKNGMLVNEARA
jgi:hypothetical protein